MFFVSIQNSVSEAGKRAYAPTRLVVHPMMHELLVKESMLRSDVPVKLSEIYGLQLCEDSALPYKFGLLQFFHKALHGAFYMFPTTCGVVDFFGPE